MWGYFEVSSGLEDEPYHDVEGDFTKENILFHVVIDFSSTQVADVKNIMISPDLKDFGRIVKEADISKIDLIDSGSMELDYEDPDERALEEYYQWEWDRDEERFARW